VKFGALIVKLQAETASSARTWGKVKGDLTTSRVVPDSAGEGMQRVDDEARGGLMLVKSQSAFRLPRHLNSLIAGIPG